MIFPKAGTLTPSKLGGAHCSSPLSQSGTNRLESAVLATSAIITRRRNNASIAMSLPSAMRRHVLLASNSDIAHGRGRNRGRHSIAHRFYIYVDLLHLSGTLTNYHN